MGERALRLLIVGLNTAPELVGIGKYTGEMTGWLAARGHVVDAVAGPPYYPSWKVADGYRGRRFRRDRIGKASVLRVPLYVPKHPGGLQRLVHHLSFALTSFLGALWQVTARRPQVVLCVAPSLLSAPAALAAAKLCRAPAWLHIQDLEVDAAFDLGLLKGRTARRVALAIEHAILTRFACVSTISEAMAARIAQKGVSQDRLVLLPNWVDCQAVTPRDGTGARATFGLPENAVIALYSGNLGHKQGLDIVAELAEAWQNRDDVHFAVFGAGPAKAQLERAAARLPNLTVGDLVPSEQLAALLSCADIHLLPQAPEAADLVLPSKLTGMLASGRPVIAAARPGTELCRMVEGAGIAVPDNTVASFDGALRELVDAPERRSELARTARARAEETFDKTAVLARLEANLYELSAGPAMNDIPRPTVARGE